ncbi:MAG TPA: HAD-IIA family hydrolase [Candidatus Hydrogenedens sp.]|nr:HAD-IIA family hydrolase [Candidatus Hydrogenedens sp.]HOK10041.1 HAD-IIA family hydrolase [Candidatus Hydrogenedens sp.]
MSDSSTKIVKNYLIDMDGVLVKGNSVIPGANNFIQRLNEAGSKFLVLTNNPKFTPMDLSHRLNILNLEISAENIYTSAVAVGMFLRMQKPNGTAFVLGESGLTTAVHQAGYIITEYNPDYVILGETSNYNFDQITLAVRLIRKGAKFIATNPDPLGPTETGIVPACGAMAALIEKATGRSPFYIGKPNPFMMRSAMNYLGVHSENTVIIGDRMDTDIVAGVQTGVETILVLTGVTKLEDIEKYPYRPTRVVNSVEEIIP